MFIIFGRHVKHIEKINPIDPKFKVTIGIIDKCGVPRDATHCVALLDYESRTEFTYSYDIPIIEFQHIQNSQHA